MRRRCGLLLVVGLLVPLAFAAEASAQGATLSINVPSATPGQSITVTGTGYAATSPGRIDAVIFRLSTRDGEPLADQSVTSALTVNKTFPVPPNVPPGEYLLLATQETVRGRQVGGGPGRAKLRITAAAEAAGAPGGFLPGDPPPVVVVATVLALIALTGGAALCARRLRTLHRPLAAVQTQPRSSK